MTILLIGYPGAFFNWGVNALKSLIASHVQVMHSHIDLSDFSGTFCDVDGFHVVSTNFPNPLLADNCSQASIPIVGFFDDPVCALGSDREELTQGTLADLRAISASVALCADLAKLENTLIVEKSDFADGCDIVRMLQGFVKEACGIAESSGELLQELGQDLPNAYPTEGEHAESRLQTGVFGSPKSGRPTTGYKWDHTLFMLGEINEPVRSMWLDLTGPARTLYYGPYFHIPQGVYDFRIAMQFSEDAIDLPLTIELVNKEVIGRGKVSAARAGKFAANLAADVTFPEDPIEVRIKSDEGAIFGHFGLLHVNVSPRLA
ncbi:hypothetical protein [Aliiroseovarius sp. PrR006]|uniref:hypothetical protein n=1 Tax=Aliiroseovarius sp. PrR006 TaxID=2706883 RepID=UPI0013D09E38|nr:hypothetical protein [Aliiroseovarius sp. PrR006]NDW54615.1 hypothetical protein [Aliiroseovarius sp. PrR006]